MIASVCLAVWLQFNHFKVDSNAEGSIQNVQDSATFTARDRATRNAEYALNARDRVDLNRFLQEAQKPRSVVNKGSLENG